jgi:hypothetical protein
MKPDFDDLLDKMEDVLLRIILLMLIILLIILFGVLFIFVGKGILSDNPNQLMDTIQTAAKTYEIIVEKARRPV